MPMNDDRVKVLLLLFFILILFISCSSIVHDPLRFNQGGHADSFSFARDTMQNGIAEVAVYNSKDNEDVDWAENRLKKLPDPLAMDNVSIENVKKDVSSSSKAKVEKNPKKRGRKVSSPIYRPSLPKSVKYKIKQIPTHSLRFGSTYNMDFVEDLNLSIGVKGIELFKNTIFGPYLNIPNCNYQGQITKCLLLLELEQDNIDELHIRHASGNILHFTIKEFAIITGLKCTGNVDEFRYPDSTHSRLIQRYFPESKDSVNKGRLVQRFLMGEWENNQDAVEMAILYFIHTFVFSQLGDTNIPIHHFFMVEDGRYQKYPWGQIAFSKLMKTLRQKFTKEKKLYRLAGMPYSLNVWIYECASIISDEIVVKESNYIPRICNWRVVGVKPKFDMFMSSIFTQNACNDIHPTTEEMSALDLPANVNTSPSEPHTSAAKSKQVQPQDLLEFENFSTNHTDQFLRRSRRMSTTSSTPPPKRRRNAHSAKPKVTQVNQPVQLVVQTKHKIPIPDSGGNLSDIHGPSFDRKESSDKSGIKQVKKYLKKYVDKKFQHLEDLIKLNHIELVNAIRNPDKQEEENIVGTSIPTTVSGFQEGHFAHPPSTDQMFEQRSSSIAMDFPNNDPIEVDVVEAQEQNHISEQKAVEDVDTCKDKEGMNDVSDLPHTTDVHDKASVSKKDNEYEAIGGSKISQQENLDEVQHNVIKSDAVVGPNDKSDSTTSNSISSDTQEAVNALLYGLRAPMNAQPLQIVIPQQATRDCLFPLHRIYRPLSTADDQQRTTTGRMPMNDDRVKLPINANPVVVHDPLRFNQGGQSDPYSFARDTMQNGTAEAAVYNSKKLEDAVHEMGLKLKHHEENISFLKAQKNRLDNSILDMHVALCKYQTASESGSENEELSHVQSEEETLGHIFVHEKSAAGIWYELKRHHGTQASHLPLMKDVVGIVAMLGNVDDDNLSRLLSDYLGLETMLAIVCKTCDGIKALETYDKEGHINKTLGLHGLGASIGKPLDGRFLVICLEKLRPYADDFIADDPQRRLDILKPRLPNGDSPPGFLGFAVNMVNIDSVNLYCATSSGHGLRETLFYNLFSRLHVYKTREDMLQALPCIRHGAISLDGGMIKHNGVFSLGKREINVKFPKSSGRSNLPQNYFEIERQIKEMRWKKERTVEDMQREQALLERSRFNFDIKKQEYLKFLAQSSTYATQSFKQEGST